MGDESIPRVTPPVDDDKIASIRSAIDAKLHEDGVYEQIRALILSKAPSKTELSADDTENAPEKIEDELVREVLQSELVQQLLETIKLDKELKRDVDAGAGDSDCDENETAAVSEPTLFIRLAGGRAFVDQLTQEDDDDGVDKITEHQIGHVSQFFRVVVSFQGQRVSTRDVPCAVDPAFNDHFRLRIIRKKMRSGRTKSGGLYEIEVVAPWEALSLVDEPINIVLLKLTKKVVSFQTSTGAVWHELQRELVAVHRLDWRRVLCSTLQLVHVPIQLVDKMKVPVGTLDFRMDLLHFKRTAPIAKDVTAFLSKEALQKNTLCHAFYRYAKEWWHEYRSEMDAVELDLRRQAKASDGADDTPDLRLSQRSRLVKLFAEDDEGKFRMVCKFLCPLRVPLAVRSPNEAARFVALLPHESTALVGGVADEAWRSMATTLAIGRGDIQDHAVILASLLLGCGLDAYVCIGTISSKKVFLRGVESGRRKLGESISTASEIGHVWVLTRDPDCPSDSNGIIFWESLNGERYKIRDGGALRHGYFSIDCVFSHSRFHANLQPRQWKISDYSFNFDDDSAWKSMDPRRLADLPCSDVTVTLTQPDDTSANAMEHQWTLFFKRELASQRRAKGLVTKWSDELSFFLQPALNSYEMERLHRVPQLENDLFQQTIKRFVKEGSTFQAVPVMFKSGLQVETAAKTLEANDIARKILTIQGRAAQFGLAVRCFAYPENLVVAWVMLAVSYQT